MPTKQLQSAVDQLASKDIKQRSSGVSSLLEYIRAGGELELEYCGEIVDALCAALGDSNFKISQTAISVVIELTTKYGEDLKALLQVLLPLVVQRLGDIKTSVREEAQTAVLEMLHVLPAPSVVDKILGCLNDRNWRTKEQAILCLASIIAALGVRSVDLPTIIEAVLKRLEDSHQDVREAAFTCFEQIFREVGEPLLNLLRQQNLRPAQLNTLWERFSHVETKAKPLPAPSGPAVLKPKEREREAPKSPKMTIKKDGPRSPPPDKGAQEVAPIIVASERDLIRDMEAMIELLRNIEPDWSTRVQSLRKLQGIVVGGATTYSPFMGLLTRLREPLAAQVSDLRSAVAKEACQTLTVLSATLRTSFEPFVDSFVDPLLKLIVMSIQIMSESGDKCMRALLKNTQAVRMIPKLIECATGKNGITRARCMDYIFLLLKASPTSALERFCDPLETVIRTGMSDAVGDVRAASRRCYHAFANHWESRGTRFLNSLETHIKKLLFEESQKDPLGNSGELQRPGSASTNRAAKSSTQSSNDSLSHPVALGKTYPPLSAKKNDGLAALKKMVKAPPLRVTEPEVVIAVARKQPDTETFVQPSGPKRVLAASAAPERVPLTERLPASERAQRVPVDVVIERSSSANDLPTTSRLSSKATRVPQQGRRNEVFETSDSDDGNELDTRSHNIHASSSNELSKILQDLDSTLWGTRVDCFNTLRTFLSSSARTNDTSVQFPKVMKALMDGLHDPHAKVVRAALEALWATADSHCALMAPYLDKLLNVLFAKLATNRDDHRQLISQVLEAIWVALRGSVLLGVVVRGLDSYGLNHRGVAMEYISYLITDAKEHLENPNNMRACISKLMVAIGIGPTASEKPPVPIELKRIGQKCLIEIYNASKSLFLEQLAMLPMAMQIECRKLIPQENEQSPLIQRNTQTPTPTPMPTSTPSPAVAGPSKKPASPQINGFDNHRAEKHAPPTTALAPAPTPTPISTPVHAHASTSIAANPDKPEILLDAKALVNSASGKKTKPNKDKQDMVAALAMLKSPETCKEGLHRIIRLAREGPANLWPIHFETCLTAVIGTLGSPQAPIRELTLLVLKELLANHSSFFRNFENITISRIMEGFKDSVPDVCQATDDAMEQLILVLELRQCLEVLSALVSSSEGPVLHASVRYMSKVITKVDPAVLVHKLPVILPGLFQAFNHTNADVRKAVVFCLVDIYLISGDSLVPWLANLNTSQRKLVTIYINRRKER